MVKRSGARERFDLDKVERGVRLAVKNRPVDAARVEAIVRNVDETVRSVGPELSSDQIGRYVLDQLKTLDEVAYLRFASVHQAFDDVEDFAREASRLSGNA